MRIIKIVFAIFFLILLTAIVIFAVGFWNFQKEAVFSAGKIYDNANLAANALKNLETKKARSSLQIIQTELNNWFERLEFWGKIVPLIKSIPENIKYLRDITTTSIRLTEQLEDLKNRGAQLILQQKGEELIKILKDIQKEISIITKTASNEKLYAAGNFITALISWLDDPQPQHIVILFQNSSEMRPGGGFIGSYAHLALIKGGLSNLEVNDIYDTDGQLTVKVIPPEQLQTITTDWGARDANWFLDFPTSANKVTKFLEASRIYQDRNINFSGVIAINDTVIRDLLNILGPIEDINSENFLAEVQKDVETKTNKGILKKITPIIFDRLNQLENDTDKKAIINLIGDKIINKDIMIYLDNPVMESFIKTLNVGGEWFEIPNNFTGDYLAVTNANIAGGKTDAFINQKIILNSEIKSNGAIENYLIIERENNGNQRSEKWYNAINQNFIQIFTPKNTELELIAGNDEKKIKPPIDYKKSGHIIDPDLSAKTDKNIFSAWLNTPAGESKKIEIQYSRTGLNLDQNNIPYQFVFDKQSGVNGYLEINIKTPAGFIWKESGKNIFEYKSDNIPAKLIIQLTLTTLISK